MSGQSPLQQNRSLGGVIKSAATGFFNRTFSRLRGAGIGSNSRIVNTRAKWGGRSDKKDWRVRLTIPDGSPLEQAIFTQPNNELLAPLLNTKGMFWPLTPSMVIQHSANYDALTMTHSNYPAQAYQSSQVDQLNIIGEFPVQNSDDAKHWIATVQFLRTVTKCFLVEVNN